MTHGVTVRAAAEVGRVAENPRWPVMRFQLATLELPRTLDGLLCDSNSRR
jgi:hypothetical protein